MYLKMKGKIEEAYLHNYSGKQFKITFNYGYDNTSSDKFWPSDIIIINDKQNDVSSLKVFTIEHFREFLIDVVKEIHSYR